MAGYRGTAIHWQGYLCISKHAELDTAISDTVVEFTSGMWNEKTILIEALTQWLKEFPKGVQICPDRKSGYESPLAASHILLPSGQDI